MTLIGLSVAFAIYVATAAPLVIEHISATFLL